MSTALQLLKKRTCREDRITRKKKKGGRKKTKSYSPSGEGKANSSKIRMMNVKTG